MIVSADRKESQIWPPYIVKVRLNGVLQSFCIYADDEKGFILRYACDYQGRLHFIRGKIGSPLIVEKRFGKVEIQVRRSERG